MNDLEQEKREQEIKDVDNGIKTMLYASLTVSFIMLVLCLINGLI